MKQYDYLIVGAGLYGAVFAHEAKKAGKRCLVIDKRAHIAGNIYTEEVEGINVHRYGAHIFHTNNKAVWQYVNQFAEFNRYTNSPVANYHGEIYNLPFNMNTFNKMWGVVTPAEAKAKIEQQRAEAGITEPKNLEEQAISLVGTDIYEKLIKGYTGKQWGRPCTELPAFIIKRLPVRFTYDDNYFNALYQGIPSGGYTAMVEKMLDGVEVRLGVDYLAEKAEPVATVDVVIYNFYLHIIRHVLSGTDGDTASAHDHDVAYIGIILLAGYFPDIRNIFACSGEINNIVQFDNIVSARNDGFRSAFDGYHVVRDVRCTQLMEGNIQYFRFFAHLGTDQYQGASAEFPPLTYPAHTHGRYDFFGSKHFRIDQ